MGSRSLKWRPGLKPGKKGYSAPQSVMGGILQPSGFTSRPRAINPQSRLSLKQVEELKALYLAGWGTAALAKRFQVTSNTIIKGIGAVWKGRALKTGKPS